MEKRMNYKQMMELLENPQRMSDLGVTEITEQILPLVKERVANLIKTETKQKDLHEMQFGWKYGELQKFDHNQILIDFSKLLNEISLPKYKIKKIHHIVKIELTTEEDTYFVVAILESELTLQEMQKLLHNEQSSEEFLNSQS